MPSLKEIKGRIGSVQSTLKITSAMKLVASAKLRKAQQAIEGMRPYEQKLQEIMAHVLSVQGSTFQTPFAPHVRSEEDEPRRPRVAIVAMASNSSLCGAFNANAVRLALETLQDQGDADVTVYSIGRKMAEAMRKAGKPSPSDFQKLADKPAYGPAADLVEQLMEAFREDRLDRVELVYNHFVTSAHQVPVRETLLPMGIPSPASPVWNEKVDPSSVVPNGAKESDPDYIFEPSATDLLEDLLPKTLKLKLFTALLDSAASEHAARTVAMQTATDNGEDLLQELTLQYNKSRQQKITAEILDLAGGNQQE